MTSPVASRHAGRRQVAPEVLVRLEYLLYDAEGALVEAPGRDEAIEFIFGMGQASAAIERAVDGLRVGDAGRVRLTPREAFGLRDEKAVIVVDRGELPPGAQLGDEFEAETEEGAPVYLRVIDLDAEVATLDANHPLAGQVVTLELRVLDARIATRAEIAQAEAELAEAEAELAEGELGEAELTQSALAGTEPRGARQEPAPGLGVKPPSVGDGHREPDVLASMLTRHRRSRQRAPS